ncbi:MAG TPA: DUF1566 domain-containing protein [Gammaproteobacteria bacterium]|nr:DUF1566 domain-containing protein [Gammaproteobacteria bacterium]
MHNKHLTVLIVTLGLGLALPLESLALCNTDLTAMAPDSRYTDNGDGTVTDKQTGLTWKQCSEGLSSSSTACDTGTAAKYTWQQALQQVETLNNSGGFASYTDWRLPNRNELASLVERQCYLPAINENLFPNTSSSYYWSSTPRADSAAEVWGVYFHYGIVFVGNKSNADNVRLVRGGL